MSAPAYADTLLLIPLFNHGATVRRVVERGLASGFALLVVDDGSTDGGLQTLVDLPVITIRMEKNRGKGATILTGAREAARRGYAKILTLDADGQHHPEEAHLLCQEAERHATPVIVIGARRMIQDTVPRSSRFGRSFSNFWVRLECGRALSDTQSGMRLYPVKELLALDLSRLRYDFEIEALVQAVWAGVEVATVDISVHYPIAAERISHFHKVKDNWRLTLLHTSLILRRLLPWPHKKLVKRLEALGHWFFYITLRVFGLRGGHLLLWPVIASYVLCSRKIHRKTAPYFRHRFPGHGRVRRKADTLCNLMAFGRVLVDRAWLGTNAKAALRGNVIGYSELLANLAQGKGLVLLTAHVGNWQTALAGLGTLPVKVHALMQYDMNAAAKHYFDLQEKARSFEIIDVAGPFGGMIEAAAALQKGEVVTIMGDRYLKGPASTVDFLGSPVRIPDAAYILAAATQTPVAIILAAQTGIKSYELKVWDIFTPAYLTREDRPAMLQACSQRFTRILEKYLRKYPYQWYNFFDLWKQ